jgi:hypothetical protein
MIAEASLRLSTLDEDDRCALYAHVHGFDKYGLPKKTCKYCKAPTQELLGCGYKDEYRGQGVGKMAKGALVDYRGTCPVYYRASPFMDSFLRLRRWKDNLGSPLDLPNRFVAAFEDYEYFTHLKEAAEAKERDRK